MSTQYITDELTEAISQAYDNLKKKEFLDRLSEYLERRFEIELTKINVSTWERDALNKLTSGGKTKPGPKAQEIDFPQQA